MNDGAPAAPPRRSGVAWGTWPDHLVALRPLLWIPAIALFEAGRAEGGGTWWPSLAALPALVSLLSILSAVHLANGWNDRAGDRLNRKGVGLASGALRGRTVAVMGGVLLLLALVSGACLIVSSGARLALLAALGLGAAYVTPPLEWKRRPGLDLLAQAAGYGVVAFLLGAESSPSAGTKSLSPLERAIPYAFGIATVGLITMLADREGDEAVGQRTTVVTLGRRSAVSLTLGLAAATSIAGLASGAWTPGLWGILALAAVALFAPPEGGAPGDGDGDRERARWNRIAVALQITFVLLLVTRALLPFVAASVLGVAAAAHDRHRGGHGYPVRGETRRERGSIRREARRR
ncbi:MAG: UbiA family prenyltransferase [Candidatus Eisenbacteria bacterium]